MFSIFKGKNSNFVPRVISAGCQKNCRYACKLWKVFQLSSKNKVEESVKYAELTLRNLIFYTFVVHSWCFLIVDTYFDE